MLVFRKTLNPHNLHTWKSNENYFGGSKFHVNRQQKSIDF